MKKKFFVLAGVASVAALSLASCGPTATTTTTTQGGGNTTTATTEAEKALTDKNGNVYVEAPESVTYDTDGGDLDICLNYSGKQGISYRSANAWTSTIDKKTYAQNTILPTWAEFATRTRTNVREASEYSTKNDNDTYKAIQTAGYKSEKDSTQMIDLFYNSTANLKTAGANNELVNLLDYVDEMPNFKKWMDKNPTMTSAITFNGKIYYTPYFDGYNDIERMFLMDTQITAKVLDASTGWDTAKINGGASPAANVVQKAEYQPFLNDTQVYKDATTVEVNVGGKVEKVAVVNTTENIIKQQNALLNAGCSGEELAKQFQTYVKAAYKNFFEKGIYKNVSDLFISESAAYNTDELIALMRVVKANPGMITGDPNAEVETFFPRADSSNRVENIYDLAQLWGVQGVDGENGNYYFAADGTLNSLETTTASYQALDYIAQMYDEGLILTDFYAGAGSSTGYLDKYYKKTTDNASYGFMMYDYSASCCAANDLYEGIGTKSTDRKISYESKGITGILPPLTMWSTKGNSAKLDIKDTTNKTLTRYYESNRALKNNSWAIPASSDNIHGAVRMMDYMFTEYGLLVQDYGPTAYWGRPTNGDANKAYVCTSLVSGEKNAVVSNATKAELLNSGSDFWTFMRANLGSTHGIGHVRSKGINLQATNYYAQGGVANIQTAIELDGVLELAKCDKYLDKDGKPVNTWDVCVPSTFKSTPKDTNFEWDAITGFWATDKLNKNEGWVNYVVSGYGIEKTNLVIKTKNNPKQVTWTQLQSEIAVYDSKCLYAAAYAQADNSAMVPSYLKK